MQGGDFIFEKIRPLAYGRSKYVTCYNGYNVNSFKFYIHEYGYHKIIMNSGMCIKDSWWEGSKSDYYEILEEIIKLNSIEVIVSFYLSANGLIITMV